MNTKALLPVILLCLSFVGHAQDRIFKKNGDVFDARISVINSDIVVFKRYDNPSGPEYTIPKGEVARIKYANGTQDIFEENNDRIGVPNGRENYHSFNEFARNKNIVSVAPLLFTDHGYGFGAGWEHTLDKAGWISANLEGSLSWNFADPNTQKDAMFYFMPGIKVYTNLNSPVRSKFSIGPALLMGIGTGVPAYSGYLTDPQQHVSHFDLGAIVNLASNLFPSEHLYIGFEGGLGFTYVNNYAGVDNGVSLLMQCSMRFGYRYLSR